MEVDAAQDLIRTQWKGNGLQSVINSFNDSIQRPFLQVPTMHIFFAMSKTNVQVLCKQFICRSYEGITCTQN